MTQQRKTQQRNPADERQHRYPISRRSVLRSVPVVAGLASVGGFGAIGSAAAQSGTSRTLLYGVQQETGTVYEVDAASGAATELVDLQSLASAQGITVPFSASSPNGNAYDVEESRFYFTSFGGAGKLYFVDTDDATPSITLAGTLDGAAASGTITIDDDGKAYYYVENGSDDLKRAAVNPDGTIGTETKVADLAGGDSMGFGDIAFSRAGILYVSADRNGTPFNGTYDPSSGQLTEFTGISPADKFQITFAQDDTLYLHRTGTGTFFRLDESGASPSLVELPWSTATVDGGESTLTLTDLTGNKLLADCEECADDGLLAKYEHVYDDSGEPAVDGFVLDGEGHDGIAYESYVSKEGEDGEPTAATFSTEYCEVYALVKAGQEFSVQELTADGDGSVTADYVAPHAISFVAFYCTEAAAEAAREAFPSNGRGRRNR
jgi:hypothetical protein